jgi:hypothetical protein
VGSPGNATPAESGALLGRSVIASSEVLPVPAPTGVVDHHGARRPLFGQLDQQVPGRWSMTSAWASPSGRRPATTMAAPDRHQIRAAVGCGHDGIGPRPPRCPDKYRWTVACHLRFPWLAQRSVASRQLLARSGGDECQAACGPVEQCRPIRGGFGRLTGDAPCTGENVMLLCAWRGRAALDRYEGVRC